VAEKINLVYDELISVIGTALGSDYVELPDPDEITNNPEIYLVNGFGIGFGPGEDTLKNMCQKALMDRVYPVLLVNKVLATDTNTDGRKVQKKKLTADLWKIQNALVDDFSLNGKAALAQYLSDSGVEYEDTEDRGDYYFMAIAIGVNFIENFG